MFLLLFIGLLCHVVYASSSEESTSGVYSHPFSLRYADADHAQQLHSEALHYAQREQYETALAYFRLAVRYEPSSARLWSDLGVTEMRLNLFKKAKRRFLKALALDPHFELARMNIEELNRVAVEEEDRVDVIPSQQAMLAAHRLHAISSPRELDREEFLRILYPLAYEHEQNVDWEDGFGKHEESAKLTSEQKELFSQPFVVRGFIPAPSQASIQQFFSLDELKRRFGSLRVDFYPHNMREEQVHPLFTSMASAMHQLVNKPTGIYREVDVSEQGTYVQWNLDAFLYEYIVKEAKLPLPRLFDLAEDDNIFSTCITVTNQSDTGVKTTQDMMMLSSLYTKTHWKMLVVGNEEAGMFFHQDTLQVSAWQIQLMGRKKWHICPGRKERHQDSSRFASDEKNRPNTQHFYYKAGKVDMFSPDYERFPLIKQAKCQEFIVEEGDLIFYPGDYWHQTLNLDTPTVSLSSSVLLSPYDFFMMRKEMKKECRGSGRIFAQDERFCKRMDRCFHLWKQAFSQDGNAKVNAKEEL